MSAKKPTPWERKTAHRLARYAKLREVATVPYEEYVEAVQDARAATPPIPGETLIERSERIFQRAVLDLPGLRVSGK